MRNTNLVTLRIRLSICRLSFRAYGNFKHSLIEVYRNWTKHEKRNSDYEVSKERASQEKLKGWAGTEVGNRVRHHKLSGPLGNTNRYFGSNLTDLG